MRKIPWARRAALITLAAVVPSVVLAAGSADSKKYEKVDKGPKTIDVSKYPQELQDTYKKLFSKKCSKCHTLARPLNTSKTSAEWQTYVEKMRKKPNSGIDQKSAEQIVKFLTYDQQQRKDKDKK